MLQFGHEGGIRHLRIVARDDQVAQPGDPRPIRYQDQPDAGLRRGPLQSGQIGGRNGAPVIQAARRLAQADGVEKRSATASCAPNEKASALPSPGSIWISPARPVARAAMTRFSAAQPRLTNR
jgi:hypothetical protein